MLTLVHAFVVIVLIAAGCAVAPPPDFGNGPPTAAAEKDGIALQFWLDRTHITEGDHVFALVRVTNNGDEVPTRETLTCRAGPAPLSVHGLSGLPEGTAWQGLAAEFKTAVVSASGGFGGTAGEIGQFEDRSIDYSSQGCSLMGKTGPFAPGERLESILAWDAVAYPGRQFASGVATVRTIFMSSAGTVAAEASVEIEADSKREATVVDYVDLALGETDFREWLEAQPRDTWDQPHLSFWPADGSGQYPPGPAYAKATGKVAAVSLLVPQPGGWSRGEVVIDVATGMVLGTQITARSAPTPSPPQ